MKHEGTRALSNYKSIKELMRKIEDLDTNDRNQNDWYETQKSTTLEEILEDRRQN